MAKKDVVGLDLMQADIEALLLRNEGRISPAILVDAARPKSSPFHDLFEWDNDEAADKYRLAQAAALIRRWKGTIIRMQAETREVHISTTRRVQSPAGERAKGAASYSRVEDIMADKSRRADMLETVIRELAAYRRRHAALIELADVWAAIDGVIDVYGGDKPGASISCDDRVSVT